MPPLVLSIAGTDPSAGAGVFADLKTIAALGGYGLAAVTGVTVQNTRGVEAVSPVGVGCLERQLEALAVDFAIDGVKIGMLAGAPQVEEVVRFLDRLGPVPVVLDPVGRSSDGTPLLTAEGWRAMVSRLLGRVSVVTPNRGELTRLTGQTVDDEESAIAAASTLVERGPAVLVTDGDGRGDRVRDLLVRESGVLRLEHPRLTVGECHGTGCALSSAVAMFLAAGRELEDAARVGSTYVQGAIRESLSLGRGRRLLKHDPVSFAEAHPL